MIPATTLTTVPTGEQVTVPGCGLVLHLNRLRGDQERWSISVDWVASTPVPGLDGLGSELRLLTEYEAPSLDDARKAVAHVVPWLMRAARTVDEARAEVARATAWLRNAVEQSRSAQ